MIKIISPYIQIIRVDYWGKHLFIIPGIIAAVALVDYPVDISLLVKNILYGFVSACLISSANYVINEWLDRKFDQHHPIKKNRPGVLGFLKAEWVYFEYIILAALGVYLAYKINSLFVMTSILFLGSGIIYNVNPIRAKDRVYLDVIAEAVNNPISLILGWSMVVGDSIPPMSLIVAYWAGGAFLMVAKRLKEYSFLIIHQKSNIGLYRKSFSYYSINSLICSCFMYALISIFCIAILLIKYRAEYILTVPLIAILFVYYLHLSLTGLDGREDEGLFMGDMFLTLLVGLLVAVFFCSSLIEIPILVHFTQSKFIDLHLKF